MIRSLSYVSTYAVRKFINISRNKKTSTIKPITTTGSSGSGIISNAIVNGISTKEYNKIINRKICQIRINGPNGKKMGKLINLKHFSLFFVIDCDAMVESSIFMLVTLESDLLLSAVVCGCVVIVLLYNPTINKKTQNLSCQKQKPQQQGANTKIEAKTTRAIPHPILAPGFVNENSASSQSRT